MVEPKALFDRLSADAIPIAPTVEEWHALSPSQRERYLIEVNELLNEQAILAPETQSHVHAKRAALDRLGQYSSRIGRSIYLAEEMAVHYPGEPVIVPDILAVLGVGDPGEEDDRDAWVVADEGKGLDLVIEVLHKGDRNKDLVHNVTFYAHLGIEEYFVYDRRYQQLHGWRLEEGTRSYHELKKTHGRLHSFVLQLDLVVDDGALRFYTGGTELQGSGELIEQLGRRVDNIEVRLARAEEERATAEQERATAEQERATAEQERDQAVQALQESVRSILELRGVELTEAFLETLANQTDPAVLQRWVVRSATTTSLGEVLGA